MKDDILDFAWTEDLSPSAYKVHYKEAEDNGWLGDMDFLKRTRDHRLEPRSYVPWAKGAFVFLDSYAQPQTILKDETFRVASYARLNEDYHYFLNKKAIGLIERYFPVGTRAKICIDSSPVAERELAVRAGLGFIGKNGLFIHPKFGSQFFIGVIFADHEPQISGASPGWSTARLTGSCGNCTACLDACPTQAFEAPFRLNPTKCISYWTIESKAEVFPEWIQKDQKPWVFGCDVCQDVCPWNRFSVPTAHPVVAERCHLEEADLNQTLEDPERYYALRGRSPMKRLSFKKWLRNISHLVPVRVR